jgi:hypothetical protein
MEKKGCGEHRMFVRENKGSETSRLILADQAMKFVQSRI